MNAANAGIVEDLLPVALDARSCAHAPYSGFHVGAALRAADGSLFGGCNVENASYGLTLCAERNAVTAAVAAGHQSFTEVLIVADGTTTPYPCGACRQVLAEFGGPEMLIHIVEGESGEVVTLSLGELLPKAFHLKTSAGASDR